MMERFSSYHTRSWRMLAPAFAVALAALAFASTAQALTKHPPAKSGKAGVHALPTLPKASQSPAAPAAGTNQQVIYGGQAASDTGIAVADWGGGTVETTANQAYMQGHSLKIVTKGPYQGGQILFSNPVALGNLSAEKSRYLQFVIQVSEAPSNQEFNATGEDQMGGSGPASYWGGQAAGAPKFRLVQGYGPYPPGYKPGGGAPGYGGPPMGYGGPPMGYGRPPQGYANPQQQPGPEEENPGLPIKSLHLIFQLTDGSQADVMRPVPQTDSGWIRVALPLSALSFPAASASNAQLKSVVIAGDAPATIYVGEIRTIDDDTPITAIPPDEQDVARNDDVTFQGAGDGGASSLKFTWDFDTKGAFVPEQEGQIVTHRYTKPGDYKVTLMVSDLDGIKKPATVTTTVHVED